jgi:hypothetical protein
MQMRFKSGCLICGSAIIYIPDSETLLCSICNIESQTEAKCEEGHFVCNSCHGMSANDWIEQVCLDSPSMDPMKLADELMKNPLVNMHGPEHHFLVPAVLLTACYNKKQEGRQKKNALKKARERAEKVPGGTCGFWGTCGAAVGNGIFLSVYSNITPLSSIDWRRANHLSADSLKVIAEHGGPRCCKRDSFIAIREAVKFIAENLNIHLKISDPILCHYSDLNKECLLENCAFYNEK